MAPVWAHILWQPQWLADAPLRLLHTLAGLLPWGLMAWRPLVFFKKPRDWAEYIFFDGACDGRTWRMALWGYTMGGRSGIVHEVLCNQQIAEFAALEYAVHFVSALGWDRVGLVGDNFSVLQSFAAGKASVGLRVQNRILRRLVYACTRSRRSWYLCWVPGECNPADPFSRIQSGGGGGLCRSTRGGHTSAEVGYGRPHGVSPACMDVGATGDKAAAGSCGHEGPEACLTRCNALRLVHGQLAASSWASCWCPPTRPCPVLQTNTTVNLWPSRVRVQTGTSGEHGAR